MKSKLSISFGLVTSLILSVFCCLLNSCTENIDYNNKVIVAKFPYDKDCAISFTFDDNCPSCLSNIVPLFDQFNYKATFFVITNRIKDWQVWKKIHDNGFEIGNHSSDHLNMTKVYDSAILNQQINLSYDLITEKIGEAPLSFAHPGHGTNSKVDSVVFQRHLFSRLTPRRFCRWDGWITKTTEDRVKKEILSAINHNTWYVPAAHGVVDCYEPMSKSFLFNILLFIKQNEDRIIVEPFKNIALYKIEKEHARISVKSNGANNITITLTSDLPIETYNYPLTLLIKNYHFPEGFLVSSPDDGLLEIIDKNGDLQLITRPNATLVINW